MEKLSIRECLPLIQAIHNGVLTVGLWESLNMFGQADSQPQNKCARSIFCHYSAGSDFQASILKATPKLPNSVIQILIASYCNSVLDYALADIEKTISETEDDHASQEEGLADLLKKYAQCSISEICLGCFEREMELLLSQAQAEKATVVELKQTGDSFLELSFKGETSCHVKRPTHSLVYSTMEKKLSTAGKNNSVIQIGETEYQIKKLNLAAYSIFADNIEVIKVVFTGIIYL